MLNHNISSKIYYMVYLTWGIGYTGVFSSQVIGVVKNYVKLNEKRVLLVSFVPYVQYSDTKRKIKSAYKNSVVLPMIPSRNHWFVYFAPLLAVICILFNEKKIIARGSIACNLGLQLRKWKLIRWICYDGRGAEKAEFEEYGIGEGSKIENLIANLEEAAVNKANFRLAVSNKLLCYWSEQFGYKGNSHVVIPCTVNEDNVVPYSPKPDQREQYGFKNDDVIVAFSGGADLWQSFSELDRLACNLLENNPKVKLLFLTNADLTSSSFYKLYSNRIKVNWLKQNEVIDVLILCDYGVLFRHSSVTNLVASPTKFAEYLAAGLQVIISNYVGDYSELVARENLGYVIEDLIEPIELLPNTRKAEIQRFALNRLTKESFEKEYNELLGQSSYKIK